jgi:integrase
MGHSSTEMLFRVYSRYVPDITRQDGSAMDNLLLASKEKLTSASNSSEAKGLVANAQTDKETSQ